MGEEESCSGRATLQAQLERIASTGRASIHTVLLGNARQSMTAPSLSGLPGLLSLRARSALCRAPLAQLSQRPSAWWAVSGSAQPIHIRTRPDPDILPCRHGLGRRVSR